MKEKNGEHPYGDSGQLILLGLFLLVWLLDSFVLQISTFPSEHVPLYIRLILFALILASAVYFIRAGHVVVKHAQRPEKVVSTGAFRYVRHPLYLGSMLFYLGLAVSTASLISLVMVVLIFIFYNHIAGYEEKLLEERFPAAYRNYKERTGKWLPLIG
jgi:protein-S-isoprenylcysteine O-methyltransferase Ste14